MFEATTLAWYNGELVEREKAAPSIASHSFHLGIGVFDGMMAYWNEDHYYVHRAAEHIARLRNGSGKMGLAYRHGDEVLLRGINDLLASVPPATYYVRPIVYRPSPQINVTGNKDMPVAVAIFGVTAPRDVDRSLRCHLSPIERVSSRAIPVNWKVCGTYVNSYLARMTAQEAGYDDGIMLDQRGRLTEISAANLFFVQNDTLVSPAMTPEIFPGITRQTVLELAGRLGIPTREQDLGPEHLGGFQAAFAVSTLMELKPISLIEPHAYDSADHPVFLALWDAFKRLTHQ